MTAAFRADWSSDPSIEDMTRELVERAPEMNGTEFSVKANRLRRAGGWWPNALSDWETPRGRELAQKIAQARA